MAETHPQRYTVLVSNALDGDIAAFSLDAASGHLQPAARYAAREAVMPLAFTPDRPQLLYAATRGQAPSIVVYALDQAAGRLTQRVTAPIESSLAYICTDISGRYLFGASYGEHRLSVYSLKHIGDADGTPLQVIPGIEHAHAVIVSPDNRFAYVASLGSDRVFCFAIRPDAADTVLAPIGEAELEPGFGPRHLRLSPDGGTLYVLSEFRGMVAAFRRDGESGRLGTPTVSPRPSALAHLHDGSARPNLSSVVQPDPGTLASQVWAADIHVTPDGRFVYLSERTSSRLIVHRANPDGTLTYTSYVDTETQPRGFRIDPSGRFLVACGEKSSHVAVYAIDANSGALSLRSRCEGGQGANWVEIIGA